MTARSLQGRVALIAGGVIVGGGRAVLCHGDLRRGERQDQSGPGAARHQQAAKSSVFNTHFQ